MEDFVFYWCHRALHTPYLYTKYHKDHHEFIDVVSICSEYAHPVEFLIGNLTPLIFGCVLLSNDIHIVTFAAFVMFRLVETVEKHGGYEFPWAMTQIIPLNCK